MTLQNLQIFLQLILCLVSYKTKFIPHHTNFISHQFIPQCFLVNADSESMCEVFDYVHDLSRKWFHLGLSLGLRYPTLKNIEASHHHDVGDHMTDIIKSWLDGKGVRGPPSWKSLAQALNCPLVRENQLAQKIRAEHCI